MFVDVNTQTWVPLFGHNFAFIAPKILFFNMKSIPKNLKWFAYLYFHVWRPFFGLFGATQKLLYLQVKIFWPVSIYIKVTVCSYVPFSRPNCRTNLHQILHSPPTNSGKVLITSMTAPTWTPGYPKLQNPNKSRERKLCVTQNVQMGDVSSSNFSRAAPGPGWLV